MGIREVGLIYCDTCIAVAIHIANTALCPFVKKVIKSSKINYFLLNGYKEILIEVILLNKNIDSCELIIQGHYFDQCLLHVKVFYAGINSYHAKDFLNS
jgi:hypothetical protein